MDIWKTIKFVVSCQALKDEPMYGNGTVLRLVKSVLAGGVTAVRLSQINDIIAVKKHYPSLPIIGIVKQKYPNSEIVITPTKKELRALVKTGIDVIAIDATSRKRPKEDLSNLVAWFFENKQPHQLLMADCSDIDDVKNAISLKFDFIGTTLHGYTKQTQNQSNIDNDFAFLNTCHQLCVPTNTILVAEGGFNDPNSVKKAWAVGANLVVVGSAITRPHFIAQQFIKAFK